MLRMYFNLSFLHFIHFKVKQTEFLRHDVVKQVTALERNRTTKPTKYKVHPALCMWISVCFLFFCCFFFKRWISICLFRGSCELSRLNNRQNHLARKVMVTHWTITTCCFGRCFWFKETYSTVIVGTSWQADCQVLNEIDPANSIRKEYRRQWYCWACASDMCT